MSEQETPDVGARVRALRQERNLSLRALAELSELSPNTISLVERGMTSPSVSTLQRLATALAVPITSFFVHPVETVKAIFTHADERTRAGSANVVLESLGFGLEGQSCDPFLVTLKPGAGSGRRVMVHSGSELVYCLDGELSYEVGDERYHLIVGDSLLFRAEQPHRWHNPAQEPATFLLIMTATEERQISMEQHLHP
jgi:transcriptional regulator with XRE-family HTH domain